MQATSVCYGLNAPTEERGTAMPLPRWLAKINKRTFNPIEVRRAARPVLIHTGRSSREDPPGSPRRPPPARSNKSYPGISNESELLRIRAVSPSPHLWPRAW